MAVLVLYATGSRRPLSRYSVVAETSPTRPAPTTLYSSPNYMDLTDQFRSTWYWRQMLERL